MPLTAATVVLMLVHVPPAVASLRGVVAPPAHRVNVPVIGAGLTGSALTVTTVVLATLPQLLERV